MTGSKTPRQTNGNGPPLRPEAMASGRVATDDQNSTWRELEARVEELEAWVDHLSKESAEKDYELVRRQERLEAAESECDALKADYEAQLSSYAETVTQTRADAARRVEEMKFERDAAQAELERLRGALELALSAMQKNIAYATRKDEPALAEAIPVAHAALHPTIPAPEPAEARTEPDVLFRCPRCRFEHWCWKGRSGHVHLCEGCGHAWSASESESPSPVAPGVAGCPAEPLAGLHFRDATGRCVRCDAQPDHDTLPTLKESPDCPHCGRKRFHSCDDPPSFCWEQIDEAITGNVTILEPGAVWRARLRRALNLPPPAEREEDGNE